MIDVTIEVAVEKCSDALTRTLHDDMNILARYFIQYFRYVVQRIQQFTIRDVSFDLDYLE